jgi:hypothetical protein
LREEPGDRALLDVGRPTGEHRVAVPPEPVAVPPEPAPRPHRRTAEPADARVRTAAPTPSYDSAAYDDLLFGSVPAVRTYGSPASGMPANEAPEESAAAQRPEPQGHARLEQILAESGVETPSGGRSRHRRYRDEDDGTAGDDVLARVLGRR